MSVKNPTKDAVREIQRAMRLERTSPSRNKCVTDVAQVRQMLLELDFALASPELLERCVQVTDHGTLFGFCRWLRYRSRRCVICGAGIPIQRLDTCGEKCSRKRHHRRTPAYRRCCERHRWWLFEQGVIVAIPIERIAAKVGLTVEEAQNRAEVDVRHGRLKAHRRDGRITAIGKPKQASP